MSTRKWIGLGILVVGVILALFSQYLPWHKYLNIYSLSGYSYTVIVYSQTSLIAALIEPITYFPLIAAFVGLGAALLCLFPFTQKYSKTLGKLAGLLAIIGYILFPLFYYLIGAMFSFMGLSFVDLMIPSMIGGWLCIISGIATFAGSVVIPKEEILTTLEPKEKEEKIKQVDEKYIKKVKCISCGAMIKETDQFCPECGAFQ